MRKRAEGVVTAAIVVELVLGRSGKGRWKSWRVWERVGRDRVGRDGRRMLDRRIDWRIEGSRGRRHRVLLL